MPARQMQVYEDVKTVSSEGRGKSRSVDGLTRVTLSDADLRVLSEPLDETAEGAVALQNRFGDDVAILISPQAFSLFLNTAELLADRGKLDVLQAIPGRPLPPNRVVLRKTAFTS